MGNEMTRKENTFGDEYVGEQEEKEEGDTKGWRRKRGRERRLLRHHLHKQIINGRRESLGDGIWKEEE